MRVAVLVVAGALLGAPSLPACSRPPPAPACVQDAARSVVGCVDAEPIHKDELAAFLRDPMWGPGSATPPDPLRAALDAAVRLRLFAAEARRRGLALPRGTPPGSLQGEAQALEHDEIVRGRLGRDDVRDDEAQRWFDEHPEAFGEIDDVHVQAIVLGDPRAAEEAWKQAKDADYDAFAALARARSTDEASRAKDGDYGWIHAGRGADLALLGVLLAARRPGSVVGPVRAQDGRWFVMRILEAPVEHAMPWGELALAKAKNLVAYGRQEKAFDALAASLRAQSTVVVFDDVLASAAPAPAHD